MNIKRLSFHFFNDHKYANEKWLDIILAVAVLEYIHLLWTDIKLIDYAFSNQLYQFKMANVLSYIDLLYLPFVLYMFYKRMRWGWMIFFGVRLFTLIPAIQYYFKNYLSTDGAHLFPYFLLATVLDIPILAFLWKKDISNIFRVNKTAKRLTVLMATITLLLCFLL